MLYDLLLNCIKNLGADQTALFNRLKSSGVTLHKTTLSRRKKKQQSLLTSEEETKIMNLILYDDSFRDLRIEFMKFKDFLETMFDGKLSQNLMEGSFEDEDDVEALDIDLEDDVEPLDIDLEDELPDLDLPDLDLPDLDLGLPDLDLPDLDLPELEDDVYVPEKVEVPNQDNKGLWEKIPDSEIDYSKLGMIGYD